MSARTEHRIHLRWATPRDLPAVVAIEEASFQAPHWDEETFRTILKNRTVIMMVAECGETVVGFLLYQLHHTCLEVVKVAVLPSARGKGVGSALVAKAIYKTGSHHRARLAAVVPEGNAATIRLLKAHGFRATGITRNWAGDEDGFQMVWNAPDDEWFTGHQPINRIKRYPYES